MGKAWYLLWGLRVPIRSTWLYPAWAYVFFNAFAPQQRQNLNLLFALRVSSLVLFLASPFSSTPPFNKSLSIASIQHRLYLCNACILMHFEQAKNRGNPRFKKYFENFIQNTKGLSYAHNLLACVYSWLWTNLQSMNSERQTFLRKKQGVTQIAMPTRKTCKPLQLLFCARHLKLRAAKIFLTQWSQNKCKSPTP